MFIYAEPDSKEKSIYDTTPKSLSGQEFKLCKNSLFMAQHKRILNFTNDSKEMSEN